MPVQRKPVSISHFAYSLITNLFNPGPNFAWSVAGTGADIYQGHLASGGGSGQLALPYLVTPYEAIQRRAIEEDTMVFWIMNNSKLLLPSGSPNIIVPAGY